MAQIIKERNSSIEFLRLLLMLMIMGGHVCNTLKSSYGEDSLWPLMCILHVAVPTFILISGYFGIKLTWQRLLHFYLYCVIWNLIAIIVHTFLIANDLGMSDFIEGFFPFSSTKGRWFLPYYFLLMLSAPIINIFCDSLSSNKLFFVVLVALSIVAYCGIIFHGKELGGIINGGKSIIYFASLYVLGRYLHRRRANIRLVGGVRIALALVAYMVGVVFLFYVLPKHYSRVLSALFYHYPSPIVIITSVVLVSLFLNFNFSSRVVNNVATSSFAIYLFHEHHLTQYFYVAASHYVYENYGVWLCIIMILILIMTISAFAITLDRIVRMPIQKIIEKVINKSFSTISNKWKI